MYTLKVPRIKLTGQAPAIFNVQTGQPQVERVKGIEPSSSAWKADALAIVLYLRDKKSRLTYCLLSIVTNFSIIFFFEVRQ